MLLYIYINNIMRDKWKKKRMRRIKRARRKHKQKNS